MKSGNSLLEDKLWNDWITNKSSEAANELIVNYMYLVNFHAERISSQLPKSVSKEDVKSLGLLGLYDALKKFDPTRDLKFDTYASFRIRGSIIDGLRKEDWLPRSIREKAKKVEQAAEQYEQKHHREATAGEIAEMLGMSIEEVETAIKDSLFGNILSIEEKPKGNSSELKEGIGYSIPDNSTILPESHLTKNELNNELVQGIKMLNKNEQLVVSLFYNEELTFTEIGQVLGLTTSRISQIHKRSIFKLRKTLNKMQVFAN
ncbi:FliA/WhiG family RNA polymerase sigma factor [Oceanobacillus profundus]|uniref:FliA/WhiG family RNA polymerase sigma factor n=1 Tax=Oceanobacillus profundus TaxID=372463 RepID=A0A417YK80_9BACI|nr:FliA/WhiG family RNA polymerase sigma factor [Oceanobacillus profundus]MBR3121556.1 FliA/WhiG family RNA polymerase sigma factor [Oceanobacillus sp.]PAE30054.1 FliA/WhiG family RNA polymerase sigma factor [Paenibacillus sp. 7884-2]MCM3396376.1 FliA/WhiG family RNA polymerase sigma factor [Oceanobacillus profundus]MDO6449614.1 FliA/WhiG family RNA polymerase sigma factor [Oceanobacillus profundus]RHW33619.1 FliA/WhiG family RNA polymerase sigma factor [Oceanobacillus profundus]